MCDPAPSVDLPVSDDAFQRGLFTRLANDGEFTVADAVTSFLKFESEETNFRTHSDKHIWPWQSCYALLRIVREISAIEGLDKLVAFVLQLKKREVHNPDTGKQIMYEDCRVWTDLPYFGWTVSDELNTGIYGLDGKLVPPEELKCMENLVIYMARLSNATDIPYSSLTPPITDFTGWAMHDFRNAFKEPNESFEHKKHTTRCWCLWLIHAGERLLTNCQHAPGWSSGDPDDITQMSQKDWEIWKMTTRTAREKYDKDTTRLVDDALKSMRDAEDKHGGPYGKSEARNH